MGCLLFNYLQKNLSKYVPQFIFSREKLVKLEFGLLQDDK